VKVSPLVARFSKHPRLMLGAAAVLALYGLALLAPVLAPYDPTAQLDLAAGRLLPPSWAHPLGTDAYSRDLLSRLLFGARLSLSIAALAVLLAVTVGTAVGLVAGLIGGWVDALLMRAVDAALAIPRVFLLLVTLALWEHGGLSALVLVLGLTGWFGTSRLVRAEVQSIRQRDFITAARALGLPPGRIALRHVLPNVAAPVIVTATLGVGNTVLIEAGLSFLGLGVAPPRPSWGAMIADSQPFLTTAPWQGIVPGLAVVVTVMAFSLLGDGLREWLDPRNR
jgi:peptide/nickel transport system permease protein